MSLLSLIFGNKPKTASVAKERLQLIIAHERNGQSSKQDFLPDLQKELIAQTSRYLLCSPLSIREIAEHFRFSSEYYFSNFFKRHTGTTPSAFRKANLHAQTLLL